MDSIFHVVQLVRLKCPIQHSDRIHGGQSPVRLYCCPFPSDLCALNQSKCSVHRPPNTRTHIRTCTHAYTCWIKLAESPSEPEQQPIWKRKREKIPSKINKSENKQTKAQKVVMLRKCVNKLNIYLQNSQVLQTDFLSLVLLFGQPKWLLTINHDWNRLKCNDQM